MRKSRCRFLGLWLTLYQPVEIHNENQDFFVSACTAEAESVELTTGKRNPEAQGSLWASNLASSLSLAFK